MTPHLDRVSASMVSRRRLLGQFSGLALAITAVACGGPAASPTSAPAPTTAPAPAKAPEAVKPTSAATAAAPAAKTGGAHLRWMVLSAPWVDMLKSNQAEFEQQTGHTVTIDSQTWQEKLLAILTAGSDEVDFYMSNKGTYGLRYAESGWYEDMQQHVATAGSDYDFKDFAQAAIDTCTVNGKLIGIPTWADHNFYYYRKDLYEKAGIGPLATDKAITFAQFAEHMGKLTKRDAQQYGVVTRGGARALIPMWVSWFVQDGGAWKDASGAWGLNTPAAIKSYMDYGRMLREWGPPGITEQTDLNEIYCQGKAASYINTVVITPQMLDPQKCGKADTTAVAPMPGGRPYFFSWYMSISPFSKQKAAAWQFIEWASNKKNNVRTALMGLPPVRTSVWTDPAFAQSDAATKNKSLIEAQRTSIAGGVADWLPPVFQVLEARDAIGAVVLKAAEGASEADVKAAADNLVKEMREIEKRR